MPPLCAQGRKVSQSWQYGLNNFTAVSGQHSAQGSNSIAAMRTGIAVVVPCRFSPARSLRQSETRW